MGSSHKHPGRGESATGYAELFSLTHYSFLCSACAPEALVERAKQFGYRALAVTDECSLAGVVKAHVAASEHGLPLIIGSLLRNADLQVVVLAKNRQGYQQLSTLITLARRRSAKGEYRFCAEDLRQLDDCLIIYLPRDEPKADLAQLQFLHALFPRQLWIGLSLTCTENPTLQYHRYWQLAEQTGLPLVPVQGVRLLDVTQKPLLDTLTAIRLNCRIDELGTRAMPNAEARLHTLSELQARYPAALLAETLRIAQQCTFSLNELRYQYPAELTPPNMQAITWLRHLCSEGARQRWPQGIEKRIAEQLERELQLIAELRYEHYFLTIHDIVQFARNRHILCQGRGSAANSVVCYCLFITEVNPAQIDVLFERFISRERAEPPDIDVDFEHERREEIIQYIYRKYGRERTALAATVITYRSRSALRDVGKAMGFAPDFIEKLSGSLAWWERSRDLARAAEQPHDNPRVQHFYARVQELIGFPRHLSQHVGGFLITDSPVAHLVPIENAAMPERTIIQWDKDDIEAMGLLKVDVLALGMLTMIRKALQLVNKHHQPDPPLSLASVPRECPATYNMLCTGDSIGVFQVESRAQMSMLPRLQPRCFYDLVIEVAIVRPGPIQGNMVHPYLRRRDGHEAVTYPSDAVRGVLARTLGVPIFQEQAIKLAMVAAGFSGGEADQLRRAMAAWGRNGNLLKFHDKLVYGMLDRGYTREFAEQIFEQLKGFGGYGFPESHSASFALLVYFSAWLKCHYPAAFYCALLNSQPMGFYSPSQIIQDARRHAIAVRPVDVCASGHDHTLVTLPAENAARSKSAGTHNTVTGLRLGLRLVKGLSADGAERIVAARAIQPFQHLHDLVTRAQLTRSDVQALAQANALASLSGHRYQAQWQSLAIEEEKPLLAVREREADFDLDDGEQLAAPTDIDNLFFDYASLGLTLGKHPMQFLRESDAAPHRPFQQCATSNQLPTLNRGRFVKIAGLVTGRQRPGTANGTLFLTLEDETGNSNIIVWRNVQERHRTALINGTLLLVKGVIERDKQVVHVVAGEIMDYSQLLDELQLPADKYPDPDHYRKPKKPTEGETASPRKHFKSRDFR